MRFRSGWTSPSMFSKQMRKLLGTAGLIALAAILIIRDMWQAIAFLVFMPGIPHVVLNWILINTPMIIQIAVLAALFLFILSMARDFASEPRVRKIMGEPHTENILGNWYPLVYLFVLAAIAIPSFSALSCMLKEGNWITVLPDLPFNNQCIERFEGFYLWHLVDSVPVIGIPQTIRWSMQFDYADSLSGFVLVAFKLMIILPLIHAFSVWSRLNNKIRERKTRIRSKEHDPPSPLTRED